MQMNKCVFYLLSNAQSLVDVTNIRLSGYVISTNLENIVFYWNLNFERKDFCRK